MKATWAILLSVAILLCLACGQGYAWKQKDFITTVWCWPPATDEALTQYAAENYNVTTVGANDLDLVKQHGLIAWLTDPLLNPATLDDPAKLAELDALIDRVKKHPALDAYFIRDEPTAADFPGLGRLFAHLKERDPAHMAYVNLYPTYASNEQLGTKGDTISAYKEHLRRYVEEVKPELISYDHYHFFKDSDGAEYFLNLALIREAAINAGVPFLNIIQASNFQNMWRPPTGDEMRFLIYTTLAYGGRGISYFTYWGPPDYQGLYIDGKPQPRAAEVAKLNGEIKALAPELMKLDSIAVYHTGALPKGVEAIPAGSSVQITGGDFVLGMFGKRNKASGFMIVNRDYKADAEAKISLEAGKRVDEFDRTTRQWVKVMPAGSELTVALRPADGRLFKIVRGN